MVSITCKNACTVMAGPINNQYDDYRQIMHFYMNICSWTGSSWPCRDNIIHPLLNSTSSPSFASNLVLKKNTYCHRCLHCERNYSAITNPCLFRAKHRNIFVGGCLHSLTIYQVWQWIVIQMDPAHRLVCSIISLVTPQPYTLSFCVNANIFGLLLF